MSTNYVTYVGPYIKIHNPIKDILEEFHTCSNPKCHKYKKPSSYKFCSDCGKKIIKTDLTVKKRICFKNWNVFKKRFFEPFIEYTPKDCQEYMFLVPSRDDVGIYLDGTLENEIPIDFSSLKELNKFKCDTFKEIVQLKEVFGVFSVETKWGVLTWLN